MSCSDPSVHPRAVEVNRCARSHRPSYDRRMNRAVRFGRFGGPEVLELVDEPVADPGPDQVRVSLRAAGLNPADYKRREGGPQYEVTLPTGIGRELAGVVEAVG